MKHTDEFLMFMTELMMFDRCNNELDTLAYMAQCSDVQNGALRCLRKFKNQLISL